MGIGIWDLFRIIRAISIIRVIQKMDSFSKLTRSFEDRHKLGRVLSSSQIVDAANSVSNGDFKAVSFRDGRLKLEAPAGPALYFLRQKNDEIISRINEALGRPAVDKIVYRGI